MADMKELSLTKRQIIFLDTLLYHLGKEKEKWIGEGLISPDDEICVKALSHRVSDMRYKSMRKCDEERVIIKKSK